MSTFTEQFSAATRSQLEAQLNFFSTAANKAFEGAEQLIALNINTTKDSVETSSAAVMKLITADDPREVFGYSTLAKPNLDSVFAYTRRLFDIATGTQTALFKSARLPLTGALEQVAHSAVAMLAAPAAAAAAPALAAPAEPAVPAPAAKSAAMVVDTVEAAAQAIKAAETPAKSVKLSKKPVVAVKPAAKAQPAAPAPASAKATPLAKAAAKVAEAPAKPAPFPVPTGRPATAIASVASAAKPPASAKPIPVPPIDPKQIDMLAPKGDAKK